MRLTNILLIIISCALSCSPALAANGRPNIVLILADDMGWGDPQCYQADSKIPTPNLDALAAAGVRFTDAHTPSSVCTPTRYTLLTGRYCWRTILKKGVLDGFGPPLIQANESTLATMLSDIGYSTACVGKWHLGMQWHDSEGNPVGPRGPQRFRGGYDIDYGRDITGGPVDVGFDTYFGISASLDMAPYSYLRNRRVESLPTERHEEIKDTIFLNGVPGVKSPDFDIHDVLGRFGDEAVKVIETCSQKEPPFFLYMPLNSPHLPIAPAAESKGKSQAGDYGDFTWETDQVVGRVMDAVRDAGEWDDTLILFTSDNGGLWHWWDFRADDDAGKVTITPRGQYLKDFNHQSNADWRGTKADIYEGGHRVPFLVSWPAKVKAGQVSDALVELTDVYATIAEIVGVDPQNGSSGMDSLSFAKVLSGESQQGRPFSVHHSLSGMFALRKQGWKLIEGRGSGGFTRPRRTHEIPGKSIKPDGQLYHLEVDSQERSNVWDANSDRVEEHLSLLGQVRESSGRPSC